jgi:hypothetical protein
LLIKLIEYINVFFNKTQKKSINLHLLKTKIKINYVALLRFEKRQKIVYIALGKRVYVEWRRLKLREKEQLCKDGMTYTHKKLEKINWDNEFFLLLNVM